MFTYFAYKSSKLSFDVLLLTIVSFSVDVAIIIWLCQGYKIFTGG